MQLNIKALKKITIFLLTKLKLKQSFLIFVYNVLLMSEFNYLLGKKT